MQEPMNSIIHQWSHSWYRSRYRPSSIVQDGGDTAINGTVPIYFRTSPDLCHHVGRGINPRGRAVTRTHPCHACTLVHHSPHPGPCPSTAVHTHSTTHTLIHITCTLTPHPWPHPHCVSPMLSIHAYPHLCHCPYAHSWPHAFPHTPALSMRCDCMPYHLSASSKTNCLKHIFG